MKAALRLAPFEMLIPRARREPLYAITDFGKVNGTYNLQIVTILAILSLKVFVGNTHLLPEAVAGASLLVALYVDSEPLKRKLSPGSVVKQVRSAAALLVHAMGDTWPGWVVPVALGILFARSRSTLSIFGDVNTAGTVSYLALVLIRAFIAIRYLALAMRTPWSEVTKPPLAIHGYNFATRSKAIRHICWTFAVGNVGIYALSQSYVWLTGTAERIHSAASGLLPSVDYKTHIGLLVLFAAVYLAWRLLPRNQEGARGDIVSNRLVMYKIHRTLHENQTLFESVHRAHHVSVYPTVLDAVGTQAAIEIIALTFAAIPLQILLPDALWFVVLFFVMKGEFVAHHSPAKESDLAHHQQHHRFPRGNYGLGGPLWDQQFGTQRRHPVAAL